MKADLVWDAKCTLGEGCVWHGGSVYFVDIKAPAVHAFTPATGERRSWPMPEMTGWLVPRRRGGWIAGFRCGVAFVELGDAPRIEWLHRLHEAGSPMRLNDGKLDPHGHLWFGTMNNADESQPQGCLYRLNPSYLLARMDEGYCVTNGPTFSADGRTLYHTDSARRTIYAFDLSADGAIANKREWLRFRDDEGYPDGMTTDADGCLWIAHWGAGRVTRRDPVTGAEIARIDLAAPHTTNLCFGGSALTDLYVTTARIGLTESALAAAPLSGALFVVPDAGRGLPVRPFDG
jgi:xylono-1,5-lactonase